MLADSVSCDCSCFWRCLKFGFQVLQFFSQVCWVVISEPAFFVLQLVWLIYHCLCYVMSIDACLVGNVFFPALLLLFWRTTLEAFFGAHILPKLLLRLSLNLLIFYSYFRGQIKSLVQASWSTVVLTTWPETQGDRRQLPVRPIPVSRPCVFCTGRSVWFCSHTIFCFSTNRFESFPFFTSFGAIPLRSPAFVTLQAIHPLILTICSQRKNKSSLFSVI